MVVYTKKQWRHFTNQTKHDSLLLWIHTCTKSRLTALSGRANDIEPTGTVIHVLSERFPLADSHSELLWHSLSVGPWARGRSASNEEHTQGDHVMKAWTKASTKLAGHPDLPRGAPPPPIPSTQEQMSSPAPQLHSSPTIDTETLSMAHKPTLTPTLGSWPHLGPHSVPPTHPCVPTSHPAQFTC